MPIRVEVDSNEIIIDEHRFPNRTKESYIYEHLLYFLSKAAYQYLPSITIKIIDGKVYVTQGHQFVSIARDLGRNRVQAFIDQCSADQDINRFLIRPTVKQLPLSDVESRVNRSHSPSADYRWFVIFFFKDH
ncbi:MAG: hypothetical protein HC921_15190 [Synechococcaceae cyanobacterium SM2_3_1]|nr:hypothetical protein [Synechococcaceae cyanobacterium SM2_3_1]